jgi:predicted RNA-binding Zn-ribbon protein involved in translation (DUF1610 family)
MKRRTLLKVLFGVPLAAIPVSLAKAEPFVTKRPGYSPPAIDLGNPKGSTFFGCPNCGASMHAAAEHAGFECGNCGALVSYKEMSRRNASECAARHYSQPVYLNPNHGVTRSEDSTPFPLLYPSIGDIYKRKYQ